MTKPKVIFVGSFKEKAKDGSVGGQMFACRSLIQGKLSEKVTFILVDSTADSVPAPPLFKRLPKVMLRSWVFITKLFNFKASHCILFTSAGFSFVEKGFMLLAAKLLFKKTIIAPRSGLIKKNMEDSFFMKWYIPFIIRKADFVLCQSKEWMLYYNSISGSHKKDISKKFIVQQNWIDEKPYIQNRPQYQQKKTDDFFSILYIGWLEEYKGILDIIDAIHTVYYHEKNIRLWVLGAGGAEEKAKTLTKQLGLDKVIRFQGWANFEEKMAALRTADLYVLPSHFEGFPNALLEAMASEMPVIATRVGAIPDFIVDGENGLLVNKQKPDMLAEKILLLIRDTHLRNTLAKNARKSVLKNNTVDVASENIEKIFTNDFLHP